MSEQYLCSSCGYVIDERLHPVPDIGGAPFPLNLGEKPGCPICGASSEMFRPCECNPQAHIHHPSTDIDVKRLAALAKYEAHLCEANRFFKLTFRDESQPIQRILHELSATMPGRRAVVRSEIIVHAAYHVLLDHSANYYWFCRILASAAENAGSLPIQKQDVLQAIQTNTLQLGTAFVNSRPLRDFSHWETAAGVVRGALILEPAADSTHRLIINPVYGHVHQQVPTGHR